MIEIFMYQAECGNAARIRFKGTDGEFHNVFIDGGVERTYKHVLGSQIKTTITDNEAIDLFIVSHIHDDHIGGAVSYIKAINKGIITDNVKSWFYNPPRFPNPALTTRSIAQGDMLLKYLQTTNTIQAGDVTNESPEVDLHGLKIKILSPTAAKLASLRTKYAGSRSFELTEPTERGIKKYDYDTPLESFNLDRWSEDDSVENGSSIAVLTEYNNLKVLWLADSHPSVVANSLKNMGFSKENPIKCDWVKVTHHGSKANNSNELYDLIRCNKYILSVNGENIHCLPTKECIARILRNANRPEDSHYELYFTYDNPTLRRIFKVDGEGIFEKWRFSVNFLKGEKWISIADSIPDPITVLTR